MKEEIEIRGEWDRDFLKYFKNKKSKAKRDLAVLMKLGILNQSREIKILELFCGKGECQELLIDNGYIKVFGSDISEVLAHKTRKDCRVQVCNGTNLSYKSNVFDLIFINEGLHHLHGENEIKMCFDEIKRVLKRGGFFVFYEPANTIFRKLASLMIFSPLSNVSQKTKLIRDILIKEAKDYGFWLKNIPQILRLLEGAGFEIKKRDKTLIHMVIISNLNNNNA